MVKCGPNQGRPSKLEWFPIKRGNEDGGELLACFELYMLDDENCMVPVLPPKVGGLYRLPTGIRPELQRTMIEVNLAKILRIMASQVAQSISLGSGLGCEKHENLPALGRRLSAGHLRVRWTQDRDRDHQERQTEPQLCQTGRLLRHCKLFKVSISPSILLASY